LLTNVLQLLRASAPNSIRPPNRGPRCGKLVGMAPLDTRRLLQIIILIVLAGILAGAHFAKRPLQESAGTPQTPAKSTAVPPEYICLDEAIKAEAPDGSTVFVSLQVKPSQCESAVMPSPLSKEDRDLLYDMSRDASNVSELRFADEIRETGGQKRTWTPMIEMGVKNFRRMRAQLCSKHPEMFVYQLKDDGGRTAPKPCSKE
jgi:hypothetical protein